MPAYEVTLAQGKMTTSTARLLANVKLFTSTGSVGVESHMRTLLPGPLALMLIGREVLELLGLKPSWAYITEILIAKTRQPNKNNGHKNILAMAEN